MDLSSRYEILDTIATGDFATVYRARDRELGREVAVKQIHQQFLSDRQQLARYWQEAQLLASLQHPNVLTIYDVVRSRGWLILELMQGSLKDRSGGRPLDLDFLRLALVGCLGGLQFLHTNGVIHGDVKPSNLLVDARNRVVLGDFGLARRASNEEGSLLKGTTKYMAPELVSNQFGAVGPASDLYSLGFSAYELMCGEQFESLFPGLSSFGRDKQIAWMMWHAAADRKLPEIDRVLEGVPEDLKRVVQKLVVKDQARRYQSASDALRDLRTDPRLADQPPEEEDPQSLAAAEAAAKKKRRLRWVAIVACALSLMLCVAQFLPKKKTPQPVGPPPPTRAAVTHVYPDEWRLALRSAEDGKASEISLTRFDQIFLNNQSCNLRDLRAEDTVVIKQARDDSGRRIKEVRASRPEVHSGQIKKLVADEGYFILMIGEGDHQGDELPISVPVDQRILLNGRENVSGKPVRLADLKKGDRVVVHHAGGESGRVARGLTVQRVVTVEGIIRDLDAKSLTVAVGEGPRAELLKLPFAPDCEVTINSQRFISGKLLKSANLKTGDEVRIDHDTQVVRVHANRIEGDGGKIQQVHFDARTLDVILQDSGEMITYFIGPECEVTLAGEPAELTGLRDGDRVDITHDSPGATRRNAISVRAVRGPDSSRWALLIGIQDYEDKTLSRLVHPVADAELLQDVLIKRYAVPRQNAKLLTDESQVRLEQVVPEWLGKIGPEGKVIVYFAGHAYRRDGQQVYLAPKNFDLKRIATTGLPLRWLVDQLEQCAAKEKLLLLDCSHAGSGADLARQPSTAEMVDALSATPGRSPLRTITAVVSCRAGQRGLPWGAKGHGMFAWLLAEAYRGDADKNRDSRLEPTELVEFLAAAMATASGQLGGEQLPHLFLPDDRPPRLSEDAKKAIRHLAASLRSSRLDVEAVGQQVAAAEQLAGREPEPKLLHGLLLLKARLRNDALVQFAELKVDHPQLLLPVQSMAWAHFEAKSYKSGVGELLDLVSIIPRPKTPADPYRPEHQEIFHWAGQLREFVDFIPKESQRPPAQLLDALDAAVTARGPTANEHYQRGRADSRNTAQDFDRRIAASAAPATVALLKVQRRQVNRYAEFALEDVAQQILAGLDR